MHFSPRFDRMSFRRSGGAALALIACVAFAHFPVPAHAGTGSMAAAPDDAVEAGVPSFVVLGPEALGLSAPPTCLKLLPDGRVLAVAHQEIAFGDGARWETFRSAGDDAGSISSKVAVDANGRIFTGSTGNLARLDLGQDAHWRLVPATPLPATNGVNNAMMTGVTVLPDAWYWNAGSGAIVSWQPGQTARMVGEVEAIEHVFALSPDVFVSSESNGRLFRLDRNEGGAVQIPGTGIGVNQTITCSAPWTNQLVLVGTVGSGLQLFDGATLRNFETGALLGPDHRINDVCRIGDGLFAAAVDTVGVVFFNRDGRVLQMLGREQDHRLARAQSMHFAPNGVLWVILTEGVARVEVPSPVSRFEPLLMSAIDYAKPLRHNGHLWMTADGRARRGVYDVDGRLTGFVDDSPPGQFVSALAGFV
jgi:hypothetical protein